MKKFKKLPLIETMLTGHLLFFPILSDAKTSASPEKKYLDPAIWQIIVTEDHCFAAAPRSIIEVEPITENNHRAYKIQQYFDSDAERALYAKTMNDQIKDRKIIGTTFCKGIVSISDRGLPFTKGNDISDLNDGILLSEAVRDGLSNISHHLNEMKILANDAASSVYTSSQLGILNQTFQSHLTELTRFSSYTRFNGYTLFDGSRENIKIPVHDGQSYEKFPLENLTPGPQGFNILGTNISTNSNAQNAVMYLSLTDWKLDWSLENLKAKTTILKEFAKQEATITYVDVRSDNFIVQRKKAALNKGRK